MSTSDTVIKLAELTGKSARIEPPFVLSDAERHAIEHEVAHYPGARAASIGALKIVQAHRGWVPDGAIEPVAALLGSSEEHTSELQSLMRLSYAVFCLKQH